MMILQVKLTSTNNKDALDQLERITSEIRAEIASAKQPGAWEGKETRTAHTLIEWEGTYTTDHTLERLHGDIFGRLDAQGKAVKV